MHHEDPESQATLTPNRLAQLRRWILNYTAAWARRRCYLHISITESWVLWNYIKGDSYFHNKCVWIAAFNSSKWSGVNRTFAAKTYWQQTTEKKLSHAIFIEPSGSLPPVIQLQSCCSGRGRKVIRWSPARVTQRYFHVCQNVAVVPWNIGAAVIWGLMHI